VCRVYVTSKTLHMHGNPTWAHQSSESIAEGEFDPWKNSQCAVRSFKNSDLYVKCLRHEVLAVALCKYTCLIRAFMHAICHSMYCQTDDEFARIFAIVHYCAFHFGLFIGSLWYRKYTSTANWRRIGQRSETRRIAEQNDVFNGFNSQSASRYIYLCKDMKVWQRGGGGPRKRKEDGWIRGYWHSKHTHREGEDKWKSVWIFLVSPGTVHPSKCVKDLTNMQL